MGFKQLVIVSDTAMGIRYNKTYAFGPVVREVEFLDSLFDEVVWIGFDRPDRINDASMQQIRSPKISCIQLQRVGGKNLLSFLKILLHYPKMFSVILKHIRTGDVIHTRGPSHPALIAILLSFLIKNKLWWHKYAGNWNQKKPSLSYGFQRWLLKKAKHTKVTINGARPGQPAHCIAFENPCLTEDQLRKGLAATESKEFKPPFVFTFVGRLEEAKGVDVIIEALGQLPLEWIEKVHFIGDGVKRAHYKQTASFLGDKVTFHGLVKSETVHQFMEQSHFFLLPSKSEGFPKVIAEAACYGAIPVVSNVGSICYYVNENNGFVWNPDTEETYGLLLQKVVKTPREDLKEISKQAYLLAGAFTFNNYKAKLQATVFNKVI